jgi:hypothetical protein
MTGSIFSTSSTAVSPEERALVDEPAEHPTVVIPAADWEAFEAWINRPAETIPALVKLAKVTPP